ncbi:MAG: flagellar hook protein FlgE [Halioglobus sp.]|jgi:flagellar hook-basal body protein
MASDILGTLFKAMSGLSAFTRGLDNLSNNVANLNTTGYKANDLFYRELEGNQQFGASGDDGVKFSNGQGVAVGGTKIRFVDGELAVTGNDTDMAIEGNGFFIVREDSAEYYTRAGEFILDDKGYLIDPGTTFRVAKVDENGRILDTNLREKLVSAAVATDKVQLRGTLNASANDGTVYPGADATDEERIEMEVYDANGRSYTFFMQFTKQSDSIWRFSLVDSEGNFVAGNQDIEFGSNGAPTVDSLSKFVKIDLFDVIDQDDVNNRFDGVDRISIEDNPGDLSMLGEIDLVVTKGSFVSRTTNETDRPSFLQEVTAVFDIEGYLIDNKTQRRIAAADASQPHGIADTRIALENPGEGSSAVNLTGTLKANGPVGEIFPPVTIDDQGNEIQANPIVVKLYDDQGVARDVTVSIIKTVNESTRAEYEVVFNRGQADEFSASKNVEYTSNVFGLWTLATNSITATYTPLGGASQTFDLLLQGDDAIGSLVVQTNADTLVTAQQQSGRAMGLVSAVEILANGQLLISYSNGEEVEGPSLAVVDNRIEKLELDFSAVNNAQFTQSTIVVDDINGRATGQLTSFEIQEDGTILLQYSNQDEVEDGRIAMAIFSNVSALERKGDALFTIEDLNQRILGSGEDGAFGTIVQRSIERSNVELSREFAEIIIVQRGFQASSQVINATNEMIEELYNSTRGGS